MSEHNPIAPRSDAYVDVDTGHDYDGVRELDNRLPNWWLGTLWIMIIFSIGYWVYYHGLAIGPSTFAALEAEQEVRAAQKRGELEALIASGQDPSSQEMLAQVIKDPARVEEGKALFIQNCAVCHKADGAGLVGPNLTDDAWIHGPQPQDWYRVMAKGVLDKGMPEWNNVLGPIRIQSIVAFLASIKNSNVAGGKDAQGNPENTFDTNTALEAVEIDADTVDAGLDN